MSATASPMIYLKDYQPPEFNIDAAYLYFDLQEDYTEVKAVLNLRRNGTHQHPLVLAGENLELRAVYVDGRALTSGEYQVDPHHLTVHRVPDQFILETEVRIKPQENKTLSGLYRSNGIFCTQCESHGFRRITYFLDRPDVLTRFTTAIAADQKRYPYLLSNGNLIEEKKLEHGRHWAKWEDPSLKPAYLFALVAGDLDLLEDRFVTQSGREVILRVFVERGKKDQAEYAIGALKRAMRWDEERFGREYDLDIYMIVAVSDFNFGAMENKGLNVFNDRYILAKPETATDSDFINIESVIGHEYFHNWSGNRVTVRDWFQITLKEGLTIFRDQSFTADMHSKTVKRIQDVNVIRTAQFAQDAGPMAHPIRPDHYIEVNNFYTVTVYHKGAEVIRMIETLLGREKFRKGMDLYFSRNDGKAVTTEDFVQAMEDASGVDLSQFRRWYSQAGTPVLTVHGDYHAADQTYHLTVKQHCPPTPSQPVKENFHIPLAMGLLDSKGQEIPLRLRGAHNSATTNRVLDIKQSEETFIFEQVPEKPIPSLLRNFSAPVKVEYAYSDAELIFLMVHDTDEFNRWEAGQRLATKILLQLVKAYRQQQPLALSRDFSQAWLEILQSQSGDDELLAEMLTLPNQAYLLENLAEADVDAVQVAYEFVKQTLASEHRRALEEVYQRCQEQGEYHLDGKAMGKRALKNLCLNYLAALQEPALEEICVRQFSLANNMTDAIGALTALNDCAGPRREKVFAEFEKKWRDEPLVLDKWFALQAASKLPGALQRVQALMQHPRFDFKNPNKARAVIGTFSQRNLVCFHAEDGSAYRFLADQVLAADEFNPQLAARLVEPFIKWKRFNIKRQKLMQEQLQRILQKPKLSKDVYELASKSLEY